MVGGHGNVAEKRHAWIFRRVQRPGIGSDPLGCPRKLGSVGYFTYFPLILTIDPNEPVPRDGMILQKKITFPGKKNHVPWKKYLQPLEKKFRLLWPCGPLVVWSFHPLVLWLFGPLVLWSCGPLVLWSFGPLVLWSCGPLVLWSCGSLVLCSCSALVLWSQKFYELRANHVACVANAFGGEALRPPPQPPSSQVQVECLNFFSRVLIFFSRG